MQRAKQTMQCHLVLLQVQAEQFLRRRCTGFFSAIFLRIDTSKQNAPESRGREECKTGLGNKTLNLRPCFGKNGEIYTPKCPNRNKKLETTPYAYQVCREDICMDTGVGKKKKNMYISTMMHLCIHDNKHVINTIPHYSMKIHEKGFFRPTEKFREGKKKIKNSVQVQFTRIRGVLLRPPSGQILRYI